MNDILSVSPEPFGAGLYIHIPFCVRKCAYCDFLSAPADTDTKTLYVTELIRELDILFKRLREKKITLRTIYMGGGTPSTLKKEDMLLLLSKIMSYEMIDPAYEFTMEVNPGTVTEDFLLAIHQAGVNRLSIGSQSFHDHELKLLGRIHDADEAKKAYQMARKAGFTNVSLDLMSGLPGQSKEDFLQNLHKVISLGPEHISVYSLIIEEGTPFYERYGEIYSEENEDLDREIYHETGRILKEAGYTRYEISNYCREGYESRHNSSYWMGIPYFGAGLGASSYFYEDGVFVRTRNQSDLKAYLAWDHSYEEREVLSNEDLCEEFIFLGLRMTNGISVREFKKRFHKDFDILYGDRLRKLIKAGLIERKEDRLFLTEAGLDLENYTISELLYG